MTFSETCKYHQITTDEMSAYCGIPKRTLNDWFNTKPLLMERLFHSVSEMHYSEFHSIVDPLMIQQPAAGELKQA